MVKQAWRCFYLNLVVEDMDLFEELKSYLNGHGLYGNFHIYAQMVSNSAKARVNFQWHVNSYLLADL